jgi:hypothetical protein
VVSTAKKAGDVYVSPGRGGNTKISIHQTGAVNWSIIYDQLPTAPYVPDTGRHLAQWDALGPGVLKPLFLWIASRDLRAGGPAPSAQAHRLAAPEAGFATQINFVLTPPIPIPKPFLGADPAPLWAAHLPNQRVLLLEHLVIPVSVDQESQLRAVRDLTWRQRQPGNGKLPPYALARTTDARGISGMVEMTPAPSPVVVLDTGHRWQPGRPGRPR